nr:hypothetical protein [Bacteroides uniformis]
MPVFGVGRTCILQREPACRFADRLEKRGEIEPVHQIVQRIQTETFGSIAVGVCNENDTSGRGQEPAKIHSVDFTFFHRIDANKINFHFCLIIILQRFKRIAVLSVQREKRNLVDILFQPSGNLRVCM